MTGISRKEKILRWLTQAAAVSCLLMTALPSAAAQSVPADQVQEDDNGSDQSAAPAQVEPEGQAAPEPQPAVPAAPAEPTPAQPSPAAETPSAPQQPPTSAAQPAQPAAAPEEPKPAEQP